MNIIIGFLTFKPNPHTDIPIIPANGCIVYAGTNVIQNFRARKSYFDEI
jgi:hypothetical protein